MKDEIKVGDYIRLNYGIRRVVKLNNSYETYDVYELDKPFFDVEYIENGGYTNIAYPEEIQKHSPNIDELLEESDIILYRIKNLKYTQIARVGKHTDARSGKEMLHVGMYSLDQLEILKILTNEEFKKFGYEV